VCVCRPEVDCGGRGAGWVCGVREAFCRRIEPEIDLVQEGVRGPLGCPSGGGRMGGPSRKVSAAAMTSSMACPRQDLV